MIEKVLFSGYTKNAGKGVYAAEFNSDNGELSDPKALVELNGPTYIDVTNDLKLIALAKKDDRGGIVVYDISGDDPKMLDEDFSEETSPSYVKFDASRNLIFSAYFLPKMLSSGSFSVLSPSSSFKKSQKSCIALLVAMARLMSRPKSSLTFSVRTESGVPQAIHIVPTGMSFVPPPGPAIPVAAMA